MIGTGAHVINGYVDLRQSILYLRSQKGSVVQRSRIVVETSTELSTIPLKPSRAPDTFSADNEW